MSSGNDSYELFWDDQSRLIDMVVTKQPVINTGIFTVRWHYHYLGTTLLAATREVEQGTYNTSGAYSKVWTVKRFWVIADERGLPHRMLDEQGAEYWRATWDAAGWRTISTQAADMQVWFGLPGQLLLPYTDAYTSGLVGGVTKTWYRAPIALNQWRAYDALTGMYLQPDDADRIGRTDPEGYAYARSSPVGLSDKEGSATSPNLWTWQTSLTSNPLGLTFDGCNSQEQLQLTAAIMSAWTQILVCTAGACGPAYNPDIQRRWLDSLEVGTRFSCPKSAFKWNDQQWSIFESGLIGQPMGGNRFQPAWAAVDEVSPLLTRWTVVAPAAFNNNHCLANTIGHEALHPVASRMFWRELKGPTETKTLGSFIDPMFGGAIGENLSISSQADIKSPGSTQGHGFVTYQANDCIKCKN